jgi:hypothetical protein
VLKLSDVCIAGIKAKYFSEKLQITLAGQIRSLESHIRKRMASTRLFNTNRLVSALVLQLGM